jgi:hypothetical protein
MDVFPKFGPFIGWDVGSIFVCFGQVMQSDKGYTHFSEYALVSNGILLA